MVILVYMVVNGFFMEFCNLIGQLLWYISRYTTPILRMHSRPDLNEWQETNHEHNRKPHKKVARLCPRYAHNFAYYAMLAFPRILPIMPI